MNRYKYSNIIFLLLYLYTVLKRQFKNAFDLRERSIHSRENIVTHLDTSY